MKKNLIKICGVLALVFVIGVVSLVVVVKTQVKPEKIRSLVLKILEEKIPNAHIELGSLNYDLGLSLRFHLSKLHIKLKKNTLYKKKYKNLFKVQNLNISVPYYAILLRSGNIELNVDKPEIYFAQKKSQSVSNWELAFRSQKSRKSQISQKSESSKALVTDKGKSQSDQGAGVGQGVAAGLISKINLDILLKNSQIFYWVAGTGEGGLKLKNLSLYNLGPNKKAKFSIESYIQINKNKKDELAFYSKMWGTLDLKKYLTDKILKSEVEFKIKDIKHVQLKSLDPQIGGKIFINLNKKNHISGKANLYIDEIVKYESQYHYDGKGINLKKIKGVLSLSDIGSFLKLKEKNIDFKNSKLNMAGDLSFLLNKKEMKRAKVTFSLSEPFIIALPGSNLLHDLKGEIADKNLKIIHNIKLFNGEMKNNIHVKMNFSNIMKSPIKWQSTIKNLTISRDFVAKNLYDGNKKDKKSTETHTLKKTGSSKQENVLSAKNKSQNKGLALPPIKFFIEAQNINLDNENFSMNMDGFHNRGLINLNKFIMKYGKGNIVAKSKTHVSDPDHIQSTLNLRSENFNLKLIRALLPNFLDEVSGTVNGTVDGNFDLVSYDKKSNFKYSFNVNMKATDGSIKGINLTENIQNVIMKIPVAKDKLQKKEFKVSDEFTKASVLGRFSHRLYNIKKFEFIGVKNKLAIDGNGEIYPGNPATKNSLLNFEVADQSHKLTPILEKNFGIKKIPMRMRGLYPALAPDYNYTLKLLAKLAVKKQGKKQIKKVTEKLKEKLLDKDKVKGLLKGLFK